MHDPAHEAERATDDHGKDIIARVLPLHSPCPFAGLPFLQLIPKRQRQRPAEQCRRGQRQQNHERLRDVIGQQQQHAIDKRKHHRRKCKADQNVESAHPVEGTVPKSEEPRIRHADHQVSKRDQSTVRLVADKDESERRRHANAERANADGLVGKQPQRAGCKQQGKECKGASKKLEGTEKWKRFEEQAGPRQVAGRPHERESQPPRPGLQCVSFDGGHHGPHPSCGHGTPSLQDDVGW